MGIIIQDIAFDGIKKKALFDSGSITSYITKDALPECAVCISIKPIDVSLGGKHHRITKRCFVPGKLNEIPFEFDAFVIDELGKVLDVKQKRKIQLDILVGATTMEEWGIYLNPKKQTLDLTGLKKREFVSF